MIIGSLTQTKRFEIMHPDFKKVFEYVRSGNLQEETFGWEERGRLAMEEEEGYQVQNDILFYQERPALYFTLPVGDFVIFFPEDAHAPCIGNGKMKKMVVKVKL